MTLITVPRGANFKDIEQLNKSVVNETDVVLRIPNSLNTSGAFGIEGFVLQLIGTWLRNNEEHTVRTYIQNIEPEEEFSTLCNSLYGICALSLSSNILSVRSEKIDKRTSLMSAAQRIKDVRSEEFTSAFKGFYLAIPSIKIPGNNSELLSPLYNGDNIVGRSKFLQITTKALSAVITNNNYKLREAVISNISEILRELFTNTHKHARKDVFGNLLEQNFRAISFRTASITRARLDVLSESGGKNLALFIGEWLHKEDAIPFLDITIVDSGPGFARRWTGLTQKDLYFNQERAAIVECFQKYKSTDTAESSGSGLSNVLRDLKQLRGWFRLRTGKALIERSFFNQQGKLTIEEKDIKEKDVFVEGVAFNILIPLQALNKRS